jgi:hypothetical protein
VWYAQSINRSNQPTNQSTNQPIDQSIDQSTDHLIDRTESSHRPKPNPGQRHPAASTPLRMAASMDVDEAPAAAGKIKQPLSFRVADAVVGGLFAIDPLFNTISKKARKSIMSRADSLGFSWADSVDDLKRNAEALEVEYE